MSSEASEIPVGTQFSPNLIDLGEFVKAIVAYSGDKPKQEEAIWRPPVNIRKKPSPDKTRRTKSLPLEAAVQYGLLDKNYAVTDLCIKLSKLGEGDLYREFAQHILLNLGGLRVVEAAQQMKEDGLKITGDSLAGYLSDQGFNVGVHNTAINSMRMWLAKAGLFPQSRTNPWEVNAQVKQELIGQDDSTMAALIGLNDDQRAFALALCRVSESANGATYKAADIRSHAEAIAGRRFDRANLPKTFLEPLRDAGLITYASGGTQSGKSALLTTTDKFKSHLLQPFIEKTIASLDANLTAYYTKPAKEIYEELDSKSPHIKGRALEAYAIHVMRLLGLRFVAWRKRAKEETGQAEIDVVMAGLLGGVATRWQIQCKNKPSSSISLEDVAKEVGLTPLTKATHIMIIANCQATSDAKTFAKETMKNSPLTIIILEEMDFQRIRGNPASIATIIAEKSKEIERIQRTGLDWLG